MNRHSIQGTGNEDGNPPAISESEYQALVEMVGPDAPDVLLDLLDTYLDESSTLVASIQEGIRSGNIANVLRPAHSLKSSSASLGAMRLSKLCADLEAHLRGSLPNLDVASQGQLIENEFNRVQSSLNEKKILLGG
jgi:HPt (histidine-containing phosphotransfer) domain-containing protein